ncbi:hypothetical protein D3C85_1925750 [compost metagenome]
MEARKTFKSDKRIDLGNNPQDKKQDKFDFKGHYKTFLQCYHAYECHQVCADIRDRI